MEYETVIGLEVHAQLLTSTKLFCGCNSSFGAPPNTHGCPVCLGLPGSLPVLNRRAVEMAVRMGLSVGCGIAQRSVFARKNYFYPDLPKGYQISQYDLPVCTGGSLLVEVDNTEKCIGITRVHLEEDAGKLIHDQDPDDSFFDVNRCGTPLIEIVSEPDMRSPREAYAYLTSLKQILEYLQICDCNMEEGSLRCDANISLRPKGETTLGTKIELKNMNTFRGLEKALEYEARRQEEVLRSGGTIIQQTYLWDAAANRSVPMRSKEDAHDYRYFPEPDLVPLLVEPEWVEELHRNLPELPARKRLRFVKELGLVPYAAEVLSSTRPIAAYFEETLRSCSDARVVANWVMGDVLRVMNDRKIDVRDLKITPARLGDLLTQVGKGTISAKAARRVFDLIEEHDKDPETIIREQGLTQMSDTGALEEIVRQVVDSSPAEMARYKAGEKKLVSYFVGQVMKATKGTGNPKEINAILSRILG